MRQETVPAGTAHALPSDMRGALVEDAKALAAWKTCTPLARNEWICWTITVKKKETRTEHIERMIEQLKDGKRRPCCWMGCIHRTDKKISPSVARILKKRAAK